MAREMTLVGTSNALSVSYCLEEHSESVAHLGPVGFKGIPKDFLEYFKSSGILLRALFDSKDYKL